MPHSFYNALLGRATPVVFSDDIARLLPPVPHLDTLEAPFSPSEVKTALWQMRTASSPGPDGFGPAFFRSFWPTVGDVLLAWLSSFHDGTADLARVNFAHVVLLPKKPGVATADVFRPINLQNCAPKHAAKVLTNRLQPYIPDLVAPHTDGLRQGALQSPTTSCLLRSWSSAATSSACPWSSSSWISGRRSTLSVGRRWTSSFNSAASATFGVVGCVASSAPGTPPCH